MDIKLATIILAAWGAVISTITLGWNIRTSLKDKGRIRITTDRSFLTRRELENSDLPLHKAILKNMDEDQSSVPRVNIYLYNIGSKQVVLSDFAIKYKGEKTLQIGEEVFHTKDRTMRMKSGFPLKIAAHDFHCKEYMWSVITDDFAGIEATLSDGRVCKLPEEEVIGLKQTAIQLQEKSSNKSSKKDALTRASS